MATNTNKPSDKNTMKQVVHRGGTMEGMIEAAITLLEGNDLRRGMLAGAGDDLRKGKPSSSDFQNCSGIVILESIQAGFLFTAQMGTGILLRHTDAGDWSLPVAIGLTGVGAGLALGVEKKHMVIFLNNEQLTEAMSSDFSLRLLVSLQHSVVLLLGGKTDDATAQVDTKGHGGVSSGYTSTLGVYCGPTAEGAVMAPRKHVNDKFYGTKLSPKDLLFGDDNTTTDLLVNNSQKEVVQKLHTTLQQLSQKHKK